MKQVVITTGDKPTEIAILNVLDDIKRGKCRVRYAFRYAFKETTQTVEEVDPETGEEAPKELPAWQYEEVIDEIELPLYLKPNLESILKTLYEQSIPTLEELTTLANFELPKEISLSEGDN
ncbi:MAG TPA: hypothetical protein ENF81_05795 [Thermotogaceae bacterium]|nr:hypothetical protein [Thermotogaceae bacterium]